MVFSYSSIVNCMGWIDCCKNGRQPLAGYVVPYILPDGATLIRPTDTATVGRISVGALFLRLACHDGAIYFKTPGLRNHLMEAKRFIQHLRVGQESIRHDA